MIELKARHLAAIVPVIFIAGIGLTMALNLWHTTTSKEPVKYASGEFAGQANPADIRGSYTFGDIVAAFPGLPLPDLAAAFGAAGDAAAFQVKSLEASFAAEGGLEVGTDSVRLFVARYLGLPYEPAATTGLPAEALAILAARVGGQELEALKRIVVGRAAAPSPAAATPEAPAPEAAPATAKPAATAPLEAEAPAGAPSDAAAAHPVSTEDRSVKGKTTFKELADWGVPEEALQEVLGGIGASGVSLRDFCASQGVEFSTVRDQIQALVDAAR